MERNKELWKRHLELSEGITRPSSGGDKTAWHDAQIRHYGAGCAICLERKAERLAEKEAERAAIARENLANMIDQAESDQWNRWAQEY